MYVCGLAPSSHRVRDLFQRGLNNSPCIIFIDELDALAKTRGHLSSNDEREQTLNQLLTEMDGFDATENSILVIAGKAAVSPDISIVHHLPNIYSPSLITYIHNMRPATNRPEVLDPALIRPGRFDRHISVGFPDTRGRRAILEVHTRGIRLAQGVDLHRLAMKTRGFSGADLSNVANEAALLAVRAGELNVNMTCFEASIERVTQARALSSTLSPIQQLTS